MKKSFSTIACQNLGYIEVADISLKVGISAIEVRLHNGNRFFDVDDKDISEVVAYLKDKGIIITNIGTGVGIFEYDADVINVAKRCAEIASLIGARGMRVFVGTGIKYFSEVTYYDYEGIVRGLKEICRHAESLGVEIWIETHNEFSTGKILRTLIEDVACDNLMIIWDIIHPYEFDEGISETIEYIGDRIAHVHIKDGTKKDNPDEISYRYTKLGEGELPIGEIISALDNIGYEGYYSLEWENAWKEEIRDTFTTLDEILAHYNEYLEHL